MNRGPNITDAQEQALFAQMRASRHLEESAYKSLSGADVSGAPLHAAAYHFWVMVWQGGAVEDAITAADDRWRQYATENNAKVNAASKIKQGPMAGQSAIHYRWTDPGRFESHAVFLRQMARKILDGQ